MNSSNIKTIKIIIGLTLAITILGLTLSYAPEWITEGHVRDFSQQASKPTYQTVIDTKSVVPRNSELDQAFKNAVILMQNNHYEQSLPFWHKVLRINNSLPEVHANLGFVMLKLKRFEEADKSFNVALELKADQANAYWGLAEVYEAKKMLPEAIGAMRTYLHLSDNEDFKTKARSAMWEWQQFLKKDNDTEQKKP